MAKETKTNAMRMLDAAGIAYETIQYEVDENDLSGVHVAAICGLPVEEVFKTLVLKGDRTGYLTAIIPVAEELDLKSLAILSGNKKTDMIPVKDLLPLTGYIRGGCSPIGMKKAFPTFIDESCILADRISISAGVRGTQILIAPDDLISFVSATIGELTR